MSYRPYQEIIRRKSRRVYVGRVPVGDGAPITVQTMTNTLTTDVAGTIAQIRRAELAGRGHRPRLLPGPGKRAGAEGHRARGQRADRRRHPFPLQARHRGGRQRRRLPAHQPRQHRQRRAGAGGHQGRPRPRLLHAHRRQRRLAGEAPAGEIRRAQPRGAGRERAVPRQHPAGARLPRLQDQREGVRRVPGGGGLSAAGRGLRPPAAYRHHRGRRPAHGHGEVLDRPGLAAVGRHRRHASASRCPTSRRRRCGSAGTC